MHGVGEEREEVEDPLWGEVGDGPTSNLNGCATDETLREKNKDENKEEGWWKQSRRPILANDSLLGLELDLHSIRRSGRNAFCITAVRTSLPFICGILVFMGVALSITAFPVLARILAGLKLLTTRVGEIAMAAVAFNNVVAWILLTALSFVAFGVLDLLWTCGLRQSLDPAIDPPRQDVKSLDKTQGMKISGLLPYWFHIAEGLNGGGKSSLLRSICVAALLGICGLMVPAESALIPYFDSITLHMKSYDSPVDKKSSFQILYNVDYTLTHGTRDCSKLGLKERMRSSKITQTPSSTQVSKSTTGINGPQDESVAQQKVEATAENNVASNHSSGDVACIQRNMELIQKGSDAQTFVAKTKNNTIKYIRYIT
ncbi:DNA mismatch repair protein MSH1, mitochondrial [Glycine soja]